MRSKKMCVFVAGIAAAIIGICAEKAYSSEENQPKNNPVAIAVTKKLVERGNIDRGGITVVAITGNGLKTPDAVGLAAPEVIDAKIDAFERVVKGVAHVA